MEGVIAHPDGILALDSGYCRDALAAIHLVIHQGIVKKKNAVEIADAIEKLINNPQLREEMGKKGCEHVLNTYDFNVSLNKMIEAYNSVLKK